jgi:SecD/SecF fusion protein
MQNKGAIRLIAIALALVCVYQLWFSLETYWVRKDAENFSKGDKVKEQRYLDSLAGKGVYNFLFLKDYTYKECLDRELPMGLDLKGGMNVTLEVSVIDLIRALSNSSKDVTFNKALALAKENQKSSQDDYLTLFEKAFKQIDPGAKLASIFSTRELRNKIKSSASNNEVMTVLRQETEDAIDNAYNILRNRIDRFGVTQPNIQRLQTRGRILIELPGVKEPDRVRKLLQGSANLEFWETYENNQILPILVQANTKLKDLLTVKADTLLADSLKNTAAIDSLKKDPNDLLAKIQKDTTAKGKATQSLEQFQKENPLFGYLTPATMQDGSAAVGAQVGTANKNDTARINAMLQKAQIQQLFPRDLRLMWEYKPVDYKQAGNFFQLVALKADRNGKPALTGDVITDAREQFGENKATAEVSMTMDGYGTKEWAKLTKQNVKKQVAIVLDNSVYSAPVVQNEITGGNSQITGNFTIQEAKDLANILKSGRMPAPAKIIEEEVVGPSLGQEAINTGLISFVLSFIIVLLYMWFFYARSGIVAQIALIANLFFLFGILASLQAVLTLPGIAGIVLTMGMAVDSNVLIYERMRDELRAGKGMRLAVSDGFKGAYSSILDSQLTTLITGIVLFFFGKGAIQGFATTLIIGIMTSLFTGIFITRLVLEFMLAKNWEITLGNKLTINFMKNVNIDWLGKRKFFYAISGIVILLGIVTLSVRGLNYSVDFKGGRSYIVRFDKPVVTVDIQSALRAELGENPEVKIFGPINQVKIVTKYLIDDESADVERVIEGKLYNAVKKFYSAPITAEQFSTSDQTVGVLSSQKVGPTVADDVRMSGLYSVFFALIGIFLYIWFRFRRWTYSLGGIVSLAHDAFLVISAYSLLYNFVPFSMDVDQTAIAAILTIVGYSINDSVVVFDRVREYLGMGMGHKFNKETINSAINSTLSRTITTGGTTMLSLLAIFIFGGEAIQGFMFALFIGIAIGTYSSVLIATPVLYDSTIWWENRKAKKLAENKIKK